MGDLQAEILMAVDVDGGLSAGPSAVILVRGHVFADPDNTPFLGHQATFRSSSFVCSWPSA